MRRASQVAAIGVALILSLTGCGSNREKPAGLPMVVASTDVWGSVAQAVAGGAKTVPLLLDGGVPATVVIGGEAEKIHHRPRKRRE